MKLVTIDAYPNGRTGVLLGDDILDFGLAAAFVPVSYTHLDVYKRQVRDAFAAASAST